MNNQTSQLDEKNKEKKYLWMSLSIIFFIITLILSYFVYRIFTYKKEGVFIKKDTPSFLLEAKEEKVEEQKKMTRRYIDGVYVEEGQENFYPMAVVVDNHKDARPASSLSQANLVYEAEAEGGITRFLAIFANGQEIKEIGPIRSARPYFIDWAEEFTAVFAHCGGSPEALVKITKDRVLDINEFYKTDYFWRDKSRYAPHNVYTSTGLLEKYIKEKDLKQSDFSSWKFKEEISLENRPEESKIKINFWLKDFWVTWQYNKNENNYVRYVDEKKQADKTGEEIRAKNVIVQYIPAEVMDDKLRLKMDATGKGKAILCLDGVCKEGKWKKDSKKTRTLFYVNDQEVEFNAGTTWIEVVRPERVVHF